MKDRILSVMQHEGLTSARFAEIIGIQRSAMTHIMKGRNNPSFDVILKILSNFPDINTDWLIFGKGTMLKSQSQQNITQPQESEPDLFKNMPIFSTESTVTPEKRPEIESKSPENPIKEIVVEELKSTEMITRKINKIVIFYDDKTYDTFILEKTDGD
jgi:plasmid maintenance system antidote protein VapI